MHSQLSSWTSDARRGRHVKWMKRLTVQTQWKHDTKKEHSRGESSRCVCLCTGKRMGLTFSLISFEKKRERENEPYWKRLREMGERIQKMPSSLWTVFFEIFFHSFVHWLPQPCIACVCLSFFSVAWPIIWRARQVAAAKPAQSAGTRADSLVSFSERERELRVNSFIFVRSFRSHGGSSCSVVVSGVGPSTGSLLNVFVRIKSVWSSVGPEIEWHPNRRRQNNLQQLIPLQPFIPEVKSLHSISTDRVESKWNGTNTNNQFHLPVFVLFCAFIFFFTFSSITQKNIQAIELILSKETV